MIFPRAGCANDGPSCDSVAIQWADHTLHLAHRWWVEYADRKNDEEDEHVADSLLYDKSHLPRSAPAPDGVLAAIAADKAALQAVAGRAIPT